MKVTWQTRWQLQVQYEGRMYTEHVDSGGFQVSGLPPKVTDFSPEKVAKFAAGHFLKKVTGGQHWYRRC